MKRLGDILIDSGFLSQAELQEALEAQRNDSTKKRLGEIIVEKGLLTELDILRAISSQYDLPIIDLQQVDIDQEATKVVTEQYCEENLIIPVAFDGDDDNKKLVVAIYDPLNILVTDDLRFRTGKDIVTLLAPKQQILAAIKMNYGREVAKQAADDLASDLDIDDMKKLGDEITDEVNNAPVVKLVNSIIDVALKQGVFEKHYTNHPLVTCIEPSRPLGGFLDFDREVLDRNLALGYTDTMKTMGRYFGRVYAFRPGGREVLRETMRDYFLWLLRWELVPPASRVESVLERMRGETPVTDRILSGRTDDALTLACMTLDYLMETLGYPHEQAYDVSALLPELRDVLLSEELPPALEEARALCDTLEKNKLGAVLAKAAPNRDADALLTATFMLYLRERFAPPTEEAADV